MTFSSALLAMGALGDPGSPEPGSMSFERAAQPGAPLVETMRGFEAPRLMPVAAPAHAADLRAWPAHRAGLGPEGARAVAAWVNGDRTPWLERIDVREFAGRLQPAPGPAMQLVVLVPLFLVLLGRQRRFEREVVEYALPWRTPPSRYLLGVGH